jgi:hypothetical protein
MKSLLVLMLLAGPLRAEPSPAPVAKAEKPLYKQWWLWTAAAVVLVAGVGIGLSVGLQPKTPSANTDFGTYKPF